MNLIIIDHVLKLKEVVIVLKCFFLLLYLSQFIKSRSNDTNNIFGEKKSVIVEVTKNWGVTDEIKRIQVEVTLRFTPLDNVKNFLVSVKQAPLPS